MSGRTHSATLRLLSAIIAVPVLLLSLSVASVSAADQEDYSAAQIQDWLVDKISGATVEITDATVSPNSTDNYMLVNGLSLNVLGVSIGLSPIKFTFDTAPGTTKVAILAELELFDISPRPKIACNASVGCEGPDGMLEVTGIDSGSVQIGSFEPTLSEDDLNAIVDVVNQIIEASGLSVSPPDAYLTGICVVDQGGTDKLKLTWSDESETYLERGELEAKIDGMAGALETKATDYLGAESPEWWVDVEIPVTPGDELQIDAGFAAFDVTTSLSATVTFDGLTATVTGTEFAVNSKTVTFSAEAEVGCSDYVPYIEMQSFALGNECPGLRDYVGEVEGDILTAIGDAVDDVVENTELTWPFYSINAITVESETVALHEGEEPYLIVGDVGLDGRVTMVDVLFILQYRAALITLNEDQLRCADTNADGRVTMADALHIMQFRADPDGSLGILHKPLYDPVFHHGMIDPLTL